MSVIFFLLFIVAAGYAGYMFFQAMKTGKENEQILEQNRQIQEHARRVAEENARLEKWKPIINAEDKAKEILSDAQTKIDKARKDMEEWTQKTKAFADNLVVGAQKKADETLANIKPEAERLTALAKAMQNKIDGYGMEYMVPGVGLLDELADDFGHSEAGQALKEARKKVRDMFKNGQAAQCDYVETNRRDTAIAFVADAFNGKVEEILSRVKHNNFGKLSQEIHDAVTLVNQNGAAFRNARITPEYVESRLDELKWATVVHELKVREREEQRAIQEQMREEAKVQKEIEKARKEAEKLAREQEREQREREALQKALDEARARGELEDKLRAMERQLADKDAVIATKQQQIDDSQRAISMAQQTKAGHVYVISNVGSFGENVFKIGMTRRLEPLDRVNELGDASVPFPFDVHAMIKSDNAPDLERKLHGVFVLNQMNKTNVRKEFFRASAEEIKTAVEKLGGIAHWTMLAEAAQWRETLRIEQQIATDAAYRQQWEERQVRLEETADDVADEAA